MPDQLIEEAARRFGLLSNPTRLRMLSVLLEREPMTVTELSNALGIAASNVSQHLARLSSARLVTRRRNGQALQYSVVDPSLRSLCELVCTSLQDEAERLLVHPSRARAG